MSATLTFFTGTKKVPQQIAEPIDEINPDEFKDNFHCKVDNITRFLSTLKFNFGQDIFSIWLT
ncbi:hypothetical protein NSIN_20035 [Nitrosotalea sinensis]|uniref:Uncharacterized protein n=1 Tax=Nitrosotalea sinensis TaxID=1499975 RepID=A0A2H1EER3_9ARCH|nr:hypothetical protein NSIN_20035 [Candidatus Nitrosotalea sinensis]